MQIGRWLFLAKTLLKLAKYFIIKGFKSQCGLRDDGRKQLLENRCLRERLDLIYLTRVCGYLYTWVSIYVCVYFCLLEKLAVHSIWTSSCLGKTNSTMGNGVNDIWFLLAFCLVVIAVDIQKVVKFGRNSLRVSDLHDMLLLWKSTGD